MGNTALKKRRVSDSEAKIGDPKIGDPVTEQEDDSYYDFPEKVEEPLKSPAASRESPAAIPFKSAEVLGRGAYGVVRLAMRLDNGALIAVKEIPMDGDENFAELQREIRLLSLMQHENIVRYQGCQRHKSTMLIFTDFIPGGSLSNVLKRFGTLSEKLCSVFTKQVVAGLSYLHARRVLHRDLKPQNLLLDNKGVIKICDFGAAKVLNLQRKNDSIRGTALYMAPEVVKNSQEVGRKADIWSLGITLVELLTGSPLHRNMNQVAALLAIATTTTVPELPSDISSDADDFLRCCLQPDPKKRLNVVQLLDHPFLSERFSGTPQQQGDDANVLNDSLLVVEDDDLDLQLETSQGPDEERVSRPVHTAWEVDPPPASPPQKGKKQWFGGIFSTWGKKKQKPEDGERTMIEYIENESQSQSEDETVVVVNSSDMDIHSFIASREEERKRRLQARKDKSFFQSYEQYVMNGGEQTPPDCHPFRRFDFDESRIGKMKRMRDDDVIIVEDEM